MQKCLRPDAVYKLYLSSISYETTRRSLGLYHYVPKPQRTFIRRTSVDSSPTNSQDDQKITLSNGHKLGYSACGPESSPTIFFLHGYPSSRMEGLGLSKMSIKVGARIVCPDRPGIGLSTFDANRTLLDYPGQISQLASHLGLQSYGIIGGSGGAPYALACAKILPKTQLKKVGILAGIGPVDLSLDHLSLSSRLLLNMVGWMPGTIKWLLDLIIVRAINNVDERVFRDKVARQLRSLPSNDRELLSKDPDVIDNIVRTLKEHLRQGSSLASVKECQVYMAPWGFRLEDIDYEKILLWYGTDDSNTPVQIGRGMASRLKGAILKEYPGETHFSLMSAHGEEILRDMVDGV